MGEPNLSSVCLEASVFNRKPSTSFTHDTLQTCRETQDLVGKRTRIVLDGHSLGLSSVIAVARCVTYHVSAGCCALANLMLEDTGVMLLLPRIPEYTSC